MATRAHIELFSTATVSFYLLHMQWCFLLTLQDRCFINWIIFLCFQALDVWKHPRLSKTSLFSFRSFRSKTIVHCVLWIWFHLIYEATVQISCCRFNGFFVQLPEISCHVNILWYSECHLLISEVLFSSCHCTTSSELFSCCVFLILHKTNKAFFVDSLQSNLLFHCAFLLYC